MNPNNTDRALAPRETAIATTSEGFGATTRTGALELAQASAMASAKASVEARYTMAIHRPRDPDASLQALMKDCARKEFADAALWRRKIGNENREGFSIRFAEAAIRAWKNVDVAVTTLVDDPFRRTMRVTVTDLESNVTQQEELTIQKTVERSHIREGMAVYLERKNSKGNSTYVVEATEAEVYEKQRAMVQRLKRALILSMIDPDVLSACRKRIDDTRKKSEQDPEGQRRNLIIAFGDINVPPDQIAAYLGHQLERVSPAEIDDLRTVYTTIREGEGTWDEILAAKQAERAEEARRLGHDPVTGEVVPPPAPKAAPEERKAEEPPAEAPKPQSELQKTFWKKAQAIGIAGKRDVYAITQELYKTEDLKTLTDEQLQQVLDRLAANRGDGGRLPGSEG